MSAPTTDIAPSPLHPIRQLRHTKSFYRFLLRKLGLPMSVCHAVVKGVKYAWNPAQIGLRRRAATVDGSGADARHMAEKGYLLFEPNHFEGTEAAMRKVREVFAASGIEDEDLTQRNKQFLITVAANNALVQHREILQFALSRGLIDIATAYFGRVPMLSNLAIWWTPPNESLAQSQYFHSDRADRSVLKFFFNAHDVTEEMGPFHMIGADVSDRVREAINYERRKHSRVTDEEITTNGAMEHCIGLTGPEGAGACVDTYRCLHYGSRGNSKSRLVLMIRFSDCLAPYADLPDWHAGMAGTRYDLDDVQRLALGLIP